MDGRALPKDPEPRWNGYSIGRWDGDTLVIDTIGFDDRREVFCAPMDETSFNEVVRDPAGGVIN